MTTISQSNSAVPTNDNTPSVETIKKRLLKRKIATAKKLAARVQVQPDGTRLIRRFMKTQQTEHQILMVTFFALALTGLLQKYSQTTAVLVVISLFGDIDTLRVIHHLFAVILIAQSVYHIFHLLDMWFVKAEHGSMTPIWQDFKDLVRMLKFNLGKAAHRPEFDRYSIEEKIEYWALLWGTPLMIITGIMMWFPIQVTTLLPGDTIPVARALHAWEAILATLAILTWHTYHTVIKEKNNSIFIGYMTEAAMKHEHPLEYQRIMAAYRYITEYAVATAPSAQTAQENTIKVAQNVGKKAETKTEAERDQMVPDGG